MPGWSRAATLKRLNKAHYAQAMLTASWFIFENRSLLGISAVRYPMVRAAALEAIGVSAALKEEVYEGLHDDSINLVLEVYRSAVNHARLAISALPPIRFSAKDEMHECKRKPSGSSSSGRVSRQKANNPGSLSNPHQPERTLRDLW